MSDPGLQELLREHFRARLCEVAGDHERQIMDAARSYLPRGLGWAVHRPRVLALLYRLRPAWRPTITYGIDRVGDVHTFAATISHKDGTRLLLEPWQEQLLEDAGF